MQLSLIHGYQEKNVSTNYFVVHEYTSKSVGHRNGGREGQAESKLHTH